MVCGMKTLGGVTAERELRSGQEGSLRTCRSWWGGGSCCGVTVAVLPFSFVPLTAPSPPTSTRLWLQERREWTHSWTHTCMKITVCPLSFSSSGQPTSLYEKLIVRWSFWTTCFYKYLSDTLSKSDERGGGQWKLFPRYLQYQSLCPNVCWLITTATFPRVQHIKREELWVVK